MNHITEAVVFYAGGQCTLRKKEEYWKFVATKIGKPKFVENMGRRKVVEGIDENMLTRINPQMITYIMGGHATKSDISVLHSIT